MPCIFLLRTSFVLSVKIPRYARVNTLKTSVADVCKYFRNEGYKQIPAAEMAYHE